MQFGSLMKQPPHTTRIEDLTLNTLTSHLPITQPTHDPLASAASTPYLDIQSGFSHAKLNTTGPNHLQELKDAQPRPNKLQDILLADQGRLHESTVKPTKLDAISALHFVAQSSPNQADKSSPLHIDSEDYNIKTTSFASVSSSSIETWLEQTVQELSTTTTSSLRSATFRHWKRKRSYSPDRQACDEGTIPVPLKRRFLQKHLAVMEQSGHIQTPNGKSRALPAAPTPESTLHESTTRSEASHTSTDPKWVKQRMKGHRLFRDAGTIDREDYQDFREDVTSLLRSSRHSDVKAASAQNFSTKYDFCKDKNEGTFKPEMLKHIIKEEIKVLVEDVYQMCFVSQKGVVALYDQPLKREHLPHTYAQSGLDKEKIKARLKEDGMSNTVPDGIWGFNPSKLPTPPHQVQMDADKEELISVCPGMSWPFFLLEAKPDRGSTEEARNQAQRGGATIVNAARVLLRKMGRLEESLGPDRDTYIYSATMNADMMQWWVHWAEVCKDGINYHMDELHWERFKGEKMLQNMRWPTHNILEWGILKRLPVVIERYNTIYKLEQKARAAKLGKSQTGITQTAVLTHVSGYKRRRLDTDITPLCSTSGNG